jgi:hypothetical protein
MAKRAAPAEEKPEVKPEPKEAKKPDKTWKIRVQGGTVEAALWSREMDGQHGKYLQYSISIHRSYFDDGTKKWKSTNFYRPEHVAYVTHLMQEAWKYVVLLRNEKSPEENGQPIPDDEPCPFSD